MRIIIGGGSGLIGRALTDAFVEEGHEVIILSRDPQKVEGLPSGTSVVAWDAETAEGWGHLVDGADALVNLTGASLAGDSPFNMRWTKKRKKFFCKYK